jgi:phosphoribosylformylglycinamidine cyclo-ligase
MLADGLQARIDRARWQRPPIFDWLQAQGRIADDEMHRVFNCGVGLVIALSPGDAERALALLRTAGERAERIGEVVARPAGAPGTIVT